MASLTSKTRNEKNLEPLLSKAKQSIFKMKNGSFWDLIAIWLNDHFGFRGKLLCHILKKVSTFFLPLKVWQYRILLISFPFHWTSYLHLVLQKSLRDILWFPCSRFRKCPKMSSTQRSVQKEDNFYKIVVKRLNTYNTLNFSVVEIVYLLVQFLHRTKDSCKQVYWNRNRCIGS